MSILVQNRLRPWFQNRRWFQQSQVHEGQVEASEEGRQGEDLRPSLIYNQTLNMRL